MLNVYNAIRRGEKKTIAWALGCAVLVLMALSWLTSSDDGVIDPLVGKEFWRSGVKRKTGLGTYRVWGSADFKGGDLAFKEASSIDECLFACDEHKECFYVAFINNMCYLKDMPTLFEHFTNRPSLFAAKRVSMDPLVSDSWHDATLAETSNKQFRVWDNMAFEGPDHKELMQPNFDACLQACDTDHLCVQVSFDGRRCQLKKDAKSLKKISAPGSKAAIVARTKFPNILVSHHWTKGTQKQTKDSVYQTWESCHWQGDNIVTLKADSVDACLEQCDKELFCKHVTLIGSECMLHGFATEFFEFVPGRSDMWAAQKIRVKRPQPTHQAVHTGLPTNADECKDLHEDFLVGEHYDEATTLESKFNRYRVWEGFDFTGGDLHSNTLSMDEYTLEGCLQACDHRPECSHIVLISGKECWLKQHPYQLSRMVDERTEVVAAMKLGRIGKSGLDSCTTNKLDRRSYVPNKYRNLSPGQSSGSGLSLPSISLEMPSIPTPHRHSVARAMGIALVLLLVGGGAFMYWKKLEAGRYLRELE